MWKDFDSLWWHIFYNPSALKPPCLDLLYHCHFLKNKLNYLHPKICDGFSFLTPITNFAAISKLSNSHQVTFSVLGLGCRGTRHSLGVQNRPSIPADAACCQTARSYHRQRLSFTGPSSCFFNGEDAVLSWQCAGDIFAIAWETRRKIKSKSKMQDKTLLEKSMAEWGWKEGCAFVYIFHVNSIPPPPVKVLCRSRSK